MIHDSQLCFNSNQRLVSILGSQCGAAVGEWLAGAETEQQLLAGPRARTMGDIEAAGTGPCAYTT